MLHESGVCQQSLVRNINLGLYGINMLNGTPKETRAEVWAPRGSDITRLGGRRGKGGGGREGAHGVVAGKPRVGRDLEDTGQEKGPSGVTCCWEGSEMNIGVSQEEVLLISPRASAGEQLETKPHSKWAREGMRMRAVCSRDESKEASDTERRSGNTLAPVDRLTHLVYVTGSVCSTVKERKAFSKYGAGTMGYPFRVAGDDAWPPPHSLCNN